MTLTRSKKAVRQNRHALHPRRITMWYIWLSEVKESSGFFLAASNRSGSAGPKSGMSREDRSSKWVRSDIINLSTPTSTLFHNNSLRCVKYSFKKSSESSINSSTYWVITPPIINQLKYEILTKAAKLQTLKWESKIANFWGCQYCSKIADELDKCD